MPIARVQMPDGRIARLEVPDGTTPQQVESFVFEQINAKPSPKPSPKPAMDAFDAAVSAPEKPSPLVRFGRGFADITEGVGQRVRQVGDLFTGGDSAGAYTKDRDAEIASYERGRRAAAPRTVSDLVTGAEPDPGIDWWRLGGNVAATVPAALIPGAAAATLPLRVLSGAAGGGVAAGSMFTPEGGSALGQTALGMLTGGAAPAIMQGAKTVGGRVIDLIRPKVAVTINPAAQQALAGELTVKLQQQGVNWNTLTAEVKKSLLEDAQKALDAGGSLDDAMLANKATIESVGAKPTRASLTRNPQDWGTEQNLRGIDTEVGRPLAKRAQENATAMTDYLAQLRAKTGGKATTPIEAGESAIGAIKSQDAAKEKVVSDLYDAFRKTGAQNAAVPDGKVADTLGRVADEIGTENIPGPVLSRLKEFGFAGGARTKLLTVNEADKLSRLINNNNPGHGPQSLALGRLKQSLNEALLEVPGESQTLMTARAAAAQRFAEQRAGKGIGAALDDVSPDRFVKKFIFDADVRDVRAMREELLKSPQGDQALKDVKGHLLDNLLMKSTGATNLDDIAGKPFSGVRFAKALDSIAPEKLHVLFSPEEISSLRTLQKASKLLTEDVPFSDVNHSKTAAALANLLQRLGNTPMLGQLVSPLIGVGKIGMDWVKNAADRKAVAEVLLGSANKAGPRLPLQAPGNLARVAPAGAAAATYQPSERANQ